MIEVNEKDAERFAREIIGWGETTLRLMVERCSEHNREWWLDPRFLWPLHVELLGRGWVPGRLREDGRYIRVHGRLGTVKRDSEEKCVFAAAMIESPRPKGFPSRKWHEKRIAEEEGHDVLAGSIESPRTEER